MLHTTLLVHVAKSTDAVDKEAIVLDGGLEALQPVPCISMVETCS